MVEEFSHLKKSNPIEIKKPHHRPRNRNLQDHVHNLEEYEEVPLNLSASGVSMYKFIDDSLCKNCTLCKTAFTFYTRIHHCRVCCLAFCYNCSSNKIKIPRDLIFKNSHKEQLSDHERVCKDCYDDAINYNQASTKMNIYEDKLDIQTLKSFENSDPSQCDIIMKKFSSFCLRKLRSLQYTLPDHEFTSLEKNLLWSNCEFIYNHCKYLIPLLKSINSLDDEKEKEIRFDKVMSLINSEQIDNVEEKVSLECKDLMCTKHCSKLDILSPENILELFSSDVTFKPIRNFAVNIFKNVNTSDIINYLPFLISHIQDESLDDNLISNMLIEKAKSAVDDLTYINDLYWGLQINRIKNNELYRNVISKLFESIPENTKSIIVSTHNFDKFMKNNVPSVENFACDNFAIELSKMDLSNNRIPVFPTEDINRFQYDKIKVESSKTSPVSIPFLTSTNKNLSFMYKRESVIADQVILNLTSILSKLVEKEEKIAIDIVTYKVQPTGLSEGFIQRVNDSYDIENIRNNLEFSVLNFISEHNKDKTVHEIKTKFLQSCAIYCVATYIFGIGDRHSGNIMLTKDGKLFHVDYGFILGRDPKSIFITPTMRIHSDMTDALGGVNSSYYREFKSLCNKIYSCARRHINLFISMMLIIPDVSQKEVYDELIKRLVPGEKHQEAEIQLDNVINNSSGSSNYLKQNIVDTLRSYGSSIWTKLPWS